MILHYLQHVPFEGLGHAEAWARARGHEVAVTRLHRDEPTPRATDIDLLVVLGGPMGVGDDTRFPFLRREKRFIEDALAAGRPVLGICLGAQIVADVLGAPVTRNAHDEIGWFPLELTSEGAASPHLAGWPERFTTFHWHGDAFALPSGASRLARSEACENQAFVWGDRVVALQFHPEVTPAGLQAMIDHEAPETLSGPYVQPATALLGPGRPFEQNAALLAGLLDSLAGRAGDGSSGGGKA